MPKERFVHFENKEQLMKVIKMNEINIEQIEPEFRDDEELMMEYIKNDPLGVQFVSKRLRSNKRFMKNAVAMFGRTLSYASIKLREDAELRNLAFKKGPFIVDLEAFGEFKKIDRKIRLNTTPLKFMEDDYLEGMFHTTREEYSCFDAFLKLGEILVSCELDRDQIRLITAEYMSNIRSEKVYLNEITYRDVMTLKSLYKDYKKLEKFYAGVATPGEIYEIEKWLLERRTAVLDKQEKTLDE